MTETLRGYDQWKLASPPGPWSYGECAYCEEVCCDGGDIWLIDDSFLHGDCASKALREWANEAELFSWESPPSVSPYEPCQYCRRIRCECTDAS